MSSWQDRFRSKATSASTRAKLREDDRILEALSQPQRKTPEERAASKAERLAKLRTRRNRETGQTFPERVRQSDALDLDSPGEVSVAWPGTVKPAGNAHETPLVRHRRVQNERDLTCLALESAGRRLDDLKARLSEPNRVCVVRLIRYAPRALDSDNLIGAFKGVRDEVALRLGLDDRDPRLAFFCYDERGSAEELLVHLRIDAVQWLDPLHTDELRRIAERATIDAEHAARRRSR